MKPLYQMVKDHILDLISSGQWPIERRLPSENELVVTLGVSRMTINRALRELVTEGRIERLVGVGSFVVENKVQSHPLEIRNIATEVLDRGHIHSATVNQLTEVRATAEEAALFSIAPGTRLFSSSIVHCESDMPIQLEQRLVLPSFAPAYLSMDFTAITTNEYLMDISRDIEEIEQVVQACMPTPSIHRDLQMADNEPCLLLLRRTWVNRVVVTATRLYHPALRYQFGSRYQPGTA